MDLNQDLVTGECNSPNERDLTQYNLTRRNLGERSLSGKVAVVTGASRGIGKAVAIELARQGANVAALARNHSLLNAVCVEMNELGVATCAAACDVSDSESIYAAIEEVKSRLGAVDILVNNAGIYRTAAVSVHSIETWRAIMETNLTSAMVASKLVLPEMIDKSWGRIINMSSVSGKTGEPYGSAYSASKFGLIGLTQSLALEVAKNQITVNAVCPGWVLTDLARHQLESEEWCSLAEIDPGESVEIARLSVPQQRFVEPEEVACLVAFLASEQARGITGQAINVCGGLSIQ